mmetsp:Transcript_21371/g.27629  ORF Transcript_21371/g.27629 Transcript_21371/m.27629 type:complete len:913 (-) Transcript_21371:111-2849(-)
MEEIQYLVGDFVAFGSTDSAASFGGADVYRIDLSELASVLGCVSAGEVSAILSKDAKPSVAVIANSGEKVGMKVIPKSHLFEAPPLTRTAVIDAVHQQGELDIAGRPRELRALDEEKEMTVIRLILFNLYLSGFETVYVLATEEEGTAISEHVCGTEIEKLLDISFMHVSPMYQSMQKGCALTEISEICKGKTILYCSSAILAEPSLVYEIANFELNDNAICTLTDANGHKVIKDPLYLEIQGGNIVSASKENLAKTNSILIGIHKLGPQYFECVEAKMSLGQDYSFFSCLQELCGQKSAFQIAAEGRRWQPVRTKKQLEKVKQELSNAKRKDSALDIPVHLLAPRITLEPGVEHAFVLGIPAEQNQLGLASDVAEESVIRFDVIPAPVVGVEEVGEMRPRVMSSLSSISTSGYQKMKSSSEVIDYSAPLEANVQKVNEQGDMVVVLSAIQELEDINKRDGFLIPVPSMEGEQQPNYVVAAPRIEDDETGLFSCRCRTDTVPIYVPSDIEEIKIQTILEVEEEAMMKEPAIQVVITRKVPLIGWILLPIVLTTSAASGPLSKFLPVPILLANFWRKILSMIMIFPLAFKAFFVPEVRLKIFKPDVLKDLLLAVFGKCLCNTTFYIAMMYMAIPLVGLFQNTVPVLLLGLKLVQKEPISLMEGTGAAVAFGGTVVVGIDSLDSNTSSAGGNFWIGSAFSLLSAIGLAIYLIYAKKTRPNVDIFILNFVMCITTPLSSLLVQIFVFPETLQPLDVVPVSSIAGTLFGFLLVPSLFIVSCTISLCTDVISSTGALAVMKYFDPLFISIAFLSTPVISIVLDLVLGVSGLPDAITLFGCFLVMTGCGIVIKASSGSKTETIDTTQNLKPSATKEGDAGVFSSSNLMKSPNLKQGRKNEIAPADPERNGRYGSVSST